MTFLSALLLYPIRIKWLSLHRNHWNVLHMKSFHTRASTARTVPAVQCDYVFSTTIKKALFIETKFVVSDGDDDQRNGAQRISP